MLRPSFRWRIALLSVGLVGGALAGFSAISWWQIYNAKISRLDGELSNQLMQAGRFRERARWQWYVDLLSDRLNDHGKPWIALLALDRHGGLLYQSMVLETDRILYRNLTDQLRSTPPLPPPLDQPPPPPPEGRLPQPLPDVTVPDHRLRPPALVQLPTLATETTATGTWRIGTVRFPDRQIAIALNLQTVDQDMITIRTIFGFSIPAVLLLIAGGAWAIAGRALDPIHQLTQVIRQVTAKGLDQRIPLQVIDGEFFELIQVFNQMLERLERSFTQASRFSADAAHELKTPLTILQGELERSLYQVESGSEVQQRLSNLLEEVHRLGVIIRKLLLLSLVDSGKINLHLTEVNISELLAEVLEDIELLAPHLRLETEIAAGLYVQGDWDLLVQVLQNLCSNAIKYNLPDGWIRVVARRVGAKVRISIANASKDLPVADRERLFDRFYRGDPARTRKVEGIGLGLSLAREIARAHQGELRLDPAVAGQTAFTLSLKLRNR